MSAAAISKIPLRAVTEEQIHRAPDAFARVEGKGKEIAIAKLRELADKLENGELHGCSFEWRENVYTDSDETKMVHVVYRTPHDVAQLDGTTKRMRSVELRTTQIVEV